jgi:hypothetical protein
VTVPWDAQGEAQAALRTIVADPRYGPASLSNAQMLTNLLKDLLPDAPRESSVLVAASEVGVPGMLQGNMSQGMDLGTASRLAAGSFESRTALTPDACRWAVAALASALRLDAPGVGPGPQTPRQETPRPGHDQPTQTAMARPAPGGPDFWADPATVPGPAPSWAPTPGQAPAPGSAPAPPPWSGPAPAQVPPASPAQPSSRMRAAAAVTVVGAILIIWACALPELRTPAGNGRDSFSIFNAGGPGLFWFAVEPLGVAICGAAAALVFAFAARAARLRSVAVGALFGFGIQTILLFAGYEFSVRSPDHSGPAATVGILGAIVLLVAGLIAASGPAASAPATGP